MTRTRQYDWARDRYLPTALAKMFRSYPSLALSLTDIGIQRIRASTSTASRLHKGIEIEEGRESLISEIWDADFETFVNIGF
jgi:hypothetical protein